MLPNTMRSELKSSNPEALLDVGSFQFLRQADGTAGELRFRLKSPSNCRVEYAATDPSGRPPPSSPASVDCPEDPGELEKTLAISNISPGIMLTFRVFVWPDTITALNAASREFLEGQDLPQGRTSYLVVARYNRPRNSNEIYTFRFRDETELATIRQMLQQRRPQGTVSCVENAGETTPPFPRFRSVEDTPLRPLHGLSKMSTDGFAQGQASVHPFFDTRLTQVFENIDLQQNWTWNFQWNGQDHSFESYPPGFMPTIDLVDASERIPLRNRQLGNAIPSYDLSSPSLSLAPSLVFSNELASYQVTIKTADASRFVLRCDFSINQQILTIPTSFYQKLAAGEYLVTVALETNQLHFRSGANYPPWLITAQDWVHFKINKKL